MSIAEYNLLSLEERIKLTLGGDTVAWREMKLRWFYIVKKVDDFYVELKYDEFNRDKLAVDARAIDSKGFNDLLKNNYYGLDLFYWGIL